MANLHECPSCAAVSNRSDSSSTRRALRAVLGWAAVLLLFASPASAGDEAPVVSAWANAPGWITLNWTHSGVDVYWYNIERQDLLYARRDMGVTGTFTDTNLEPNTTYNYRVCAVYDFDQACSDWVSATTLPPSGTPPSQNTPAPQAPTIYAPELTASSNHALMIVVSWGAEQHHLLHDVVLYRDNEVIFDAQEYGDFMPEITDLVPRANRAYTYQVCFISLRDETACSEPLMSMPKATPPTAPAAVVAARIHDVRAGSAGTSDRLTPGALQQTTTAHVEWQNGLIPGHFISVERQDIFLLPGGSSATALRATTRTAEWVELERISALDDPTAMLFAFDKQLIAGSQQGTAYRVCAIEPRVGEAGKVCSESVTLR